MGRKKRRHAKAGCIADAQKPLVFIRQRHGPFWCTGLGDVVDQVMCKMPDQPNGEHLGLKGTAKPRSPGNLGPIGQAEFAITINRRRAHEIPGREQRFGVRLLAVGQGIDHMIKQTNAFVSAAQHQLSRRDAARLLERHIGFQPI